MMTPWGHIVGGAALCEEGHTSQSKVYQLWSISIWKFGIGHSGSLDWNALKYAQNDPWRKKILHMIYNQKESSNVVLMVASMRWWYYTELVPVDLMATSNGLQSVV